MFGIYLLRIEIVLQGHIWKDIQTGIVPALNCFYCNPHNGPYGILWWTVSQPLKFNYAGTSAFIDFLIMILLRNKLAVFPVYAFMSWLLWVQAPYDLPIIWLTLLGLVRWPLVLLGPLAKLPVGAPLADWSFILSKPYNLDDLQYYGFMAIVFFAVVLQMLNTKTSEENQIVTSQQTLPVPKESFQCCA